VDGPLLIRAKAVSFAVAVLKGWLLQLAVAYSTGDVDESRAQLFLFQVIAVNAAVAMSLSDAKLRFLNGPGFKGLLHLALYVPIVDHIKRVGEFAIGPLFSVGAFAAFTALSSSIGE
jgi:hypothetical protein